MTDHSALGALGMLPVRVLPIANLFGLAQEAGEVVPCLSPRRLVNLAVLLAVSDDHGKDGFLESLDSFVSVDYFSKVAGHVVCSFALLSTLIRRILFMNIQSFFTFFSIYLGHNLGTD